MISRRSTPAKSLENLTLSNRFETGTEETDEVVIETDDEVADTVDKVSTNTSKVVEDDARNLELLAKKELDEREKKELADKKKKQKVTKKKTITVANVIQVQTRGGRSSRQGSSSPSKNRVN